MTPRGRKVLYVDDDAANLTTFQYCFAERFDLVLARSGEEALALLAEEPVAVLLADQRMPGMTGAELCALAERRFPEVVRMIVTAYADMQAIVAAINTGQVSRYILKPWTEERMAEELSIGLRAYELAQLVRDSHAVLLRADQQGAAAALLARQVHDLYTPLTSLRGSLYLARDLANDLVAKPTAGAAWLGETAADLKEAVSNAIAVADQLAARAELYQQGEAETDDERAAADLNQAVEAALVIVGPQLRQRARLHLSLGEVPVVAAPATRVCQLAASLLTNAIEALEPGRAGRGLITVITLVRNPYVVLEIRDTGIGVRPDEVAHVFEPPVHSPGGVRPRGPGLAVARDVVRRLHGELTITSEIGAGTCVSVALPIAR